MVVTRSISTTFTPQIQQHQPQKPYAQSKTSISKAHSSTYVSPSYLPVYLTQMLTSPKVRPLQLPPLTSPRSLEYLHRQRLHPPKLLRRPLQPYRSPLRDLTLPSPAQAQHQLQRLRHTSRWFSHQDTRILLLSHDYHASALESLNLDRLSI